MAHVEIIEANLNDKINSVLHTKKKAGAYARVSTDNEEQLTSYSSQIKHYSEMIKSNPEWEFVGVYADEGISGTQVKHRTEFSRMIDDAMNGKLDIIIAKSISRFARNTLDTLKYIRMLREKNVDVYFEKENIHTLKLTSEMFLTLYSAFAQAESESTSQNVKLGLIAKMKRGEVVGCPNCYGYNWNSETKQLEINESEAEVVRKIFNWYVEGAGTYVIAKRLNEEGYRTKKGKMWCNSVIRRIIGQEKYCGDLLQQKTYIPDVLSHKQIRNDGQLKKYFIENHHDAIVSKELWLKANEICKKRLQVYTDNNRFHIGQCEMLYEFSNKIECGCCHKSYVRRINGKKKDGSTRVYWACTVRKENKNECSNSLWLRNELLESMFVQLYNILISDKHKTKKLFLDSMEETLKGVDYKSKILKLEKEKETLEVRLSNLIDMMLDDYSRKEIYFTKEKELRDKLNEIANRINDYKKFQQNNLDFKDQLAKISKMLDNCKKLDKFDRETFNNIVEKIIVGAEDENGNFNSHIIKFVLKTGQECDFSSDDFKDNNGKNEPNRCTGGSNNLWCRTY